MPRNLRSSEPTRREFLAGLSTTALLSGLPTRARAADRPNLVFILTDDQRWDALSCAGNAVLRTPNLDRLATEGVRFTNHFCTTSICCASRASFLTGMYASRHGVHEFSTPLRPEQLAASYPGLLREAGYRTAFIGKWGLGGKLPKEAFDYFEGFPGQGLYFPKDHDQESEQHLTRKIEAQGKGFIERVPEGQPFCLALSTKAPHVQDGHPDPFRFDPVYADLYETAEIPAPPTANERCFKLLPEFLQESEGRRRWQHRFANDAMRQRSIKNFYRLVTGVDRLVGTLLDTLSARGLLDNTVVAFTSDNGFFLGEHGLAGKWLAYEESIRLPLLVRDPRLPLSRQGRVCESTSLNIDLAPTLLDLAGVSVPTEMQGRSLVPLVQGRTPEWRTDWFYEHRFKHQFIPPSEAVRTDRWKYLVYPTHQREELYDLQADPGEIDNLAGQSQFAAQLVAMRSRCDELRVEVR